MITDSPPRVAPYPLPHWTHAQVARLDAEWLGQPHVNRCVVLHGEYGVTRISVPGTWPDVHLYSDRTADNGWSPVTDEGGSPTGDITIHGAAGHVECLGVATGEKAPF